MLETIKAIAMLCAVNGADGTIYDTGRFQTGCQRFYIECLEKGSLKDCVKKRDDLYFKVDEIKEKVSK
jgi:hypothetical protein